MGTKTDAIFRTKVEEIGKDAQDFKAVDMLILFGEEAPAALRDSCFIIDVEDVKKEISTGMTISFDDQEYKILAVGNEVNTNLKKLGHIAVKFTGEDTAELPGSLYVEKKEFPKIKVGTEIRIN